MKTVVLFLLSLWMYSSANAQGSTTSVPAYDTIYTKPETFASYPGGDSAWRVYVKKEMKYPKKAWWDEIETEVTVKVVVDKTGYIKEARHLTTSGYGFEKEAVRIVTESGRWIPAMHRGQPVACEGTLVIEFRLKK
jgi:periplasmic protein TonB